MEHLTSAKSAAYSIKAVAAAAVFSPGVSSRDVTLSPIASANYIVVTGMDGLVESVGKHQPPELCE
jgi:hypothetical protein